LLAALVHVGSELGEVTPALELGAIVERHHDELRRAFDLSTDRGRDRNEKRRDGQRAEHTTGRITAVE
jgi:hypothetical protein